MSLKFDYDENFGMAKESLSKQNIRNKRNIKEAYDIETYFPSS